MKKSLLFILLFVLSGIICSYGQKELAANERTYKSRFYIGFGTGNVYGGLVGVNLAFEPVKGLGFSGGAGYYLAGLGGNGMIYYKFFANKKVNPLVYGLFGTNAAIKIQGTSRYDKIYAGPGAGIGTFFTVGRNANRIFVGLQYSFWSQSFEDDIVVVKNDPMVKIAKDPSHVGINVGFGFAPRKR